MDINYFARTDLIFEFVPKRGDDARTEGQRAYIRAGTEGRSVYREGKTEKPPTYLHTQIACSAHRVGCATANVNRIHFHRRYTGNDRWEETYPLAQRPITMLSALDLKAIRNTLSKKTLHFTPNVKYIHSIIHLQLLMKYPGNYKRKANKKDQETYNHVQITRN